MNEKIKIDPRNLYTITDYHKMMGVTIQTIYRWIKEGKVKKVEFLGKEFIDKSSYNG